VRFEDVLFLDAESVEEAHDEELSLSGGTPGLRDRGLLESAVATPRATFDGAPLHATLARMAAALGCSLARNHAFVDGNKRIALSAAIAFLELNGVEIDLGPEWEEIIVRVATGACSRDELAHLFANAMGADVDVVVG
jgi:death on curing protein